jgi:hypothetical protein
LDSENEQVIDAAATALSKQKLPLPVLSKLFSKLQNDSKKRKGVEDAILHQDLPEDFIDKLMGIIDTVSVPDYRQSGYKRIAESVLQERKLSAKTIDKLIGILKQKTKDADRLTEYNVKEDMAAVILSGQVLPPQFLDQIPDLLERKIINYEIFSNLNLSGQKLSPSVIDKLIQRLEISNQFQLEIPRVLSNQKLSEKATGDLISYMRSRDLRTKVSAIKAFIDREAPSSVIRAVLIELLKTNEKEVRESAEEVLINTQLNLEQISYLLSISYIDLNYAAKSRFFAHYLSGGDKEIETLLLWVGEPGANKPIASKLSSEERKRTLEIFAKAWGAAYLHPKYRDDLANQIATVTQDIDPSDESLLKILKVHEKNLKKFPQQALITNKISEIENVNWISVIIKTSRNVLIIHLLFWTLLIFVYPKERFKWIRPIFFWNDYVRKIAGLGYVHLLLTYVPFLRNILFVPFKSALIADARLESFNENSFFRDSNVMEAETGKVLSLIDELIAVKGSVILRGESGLGKTMCLRNLARHNKHIVVFLTSEQCHKGVIEAIQRKIMGFAGDLNFLQSLVYMGAIQIYIDGLNEVGPQTRLIISDFLKNFGGVNCIVTTQPIDWVPPGNVKIYEILPLSPEQIGQFLDGRFQAFKTPEITEESFKKLANDFIKDSTDPGLPEGELRQNEKILTNPMDLTIVAQMLIKDKRPNLLNLQKEYYEIMAEDFQRTHPHIIGGFPLQKFSENVFQMRLNDITPLPYEEYHSEIECMEDHKMVLSRQYQSSGNEKQEWFFRHDKIRDFFIVQTFLRNPARQTEYLDDPRFRGVYFLLATYLSYEDAHSLREEIIQYAAETKDHSVSDEFIKLFKNRRGGIHAE